jgi:hypothetical protein
MVDHSSMKLGRLPPRFDPRIRRFAAYLPAVLPTVPDFPDWSGGRTSWDMLGNDHIGDCGICAPSHMLSAQTAVLGRRWTPTTAEIVAIYCQVTGSRPPTTDFGTVETDFLTWWLGQTTDGFLGRHLVGWASVDPKNHQALRVAVYLLGGVLCGLNLPLNAQQQDTWDLTSAGLTGDGMPGGWGGHECAIVAIDKDGPICVTWNILQKMTWAWFDAYCEEIDACLTGAWIRGGASPANINLQMLESDMALIRSAT